MGLQFPALQSQRLNQLPAVLSPLAAATEALGLKQKQQGIRLGEQAIQRNSQELAQGQLAADDEATLRALAQKHGGDPEAMFQDLKTINPRLAMIFGDEFAKRKAAADALQQQQATGMRNEAISNAKLLEGQAGPEFGTTGMAPTYQAPLPQLGAGDVLEQGTPAAQTPEGSRTIGPQEFAPVQIPSAYGGASVSVTPQTRAGVQANAAEELRRKTAAKIEEDTAKQKAEFIYNTTRTPVENLNADEKAIKDLMDRKGMAYADAYRQIHPLPASATINIGGGLTTDALDNAARVYAKTGVLPALGMNSAAEKTKIMNRAGELFRNGDIVLNKEDVKANSKSLTQATALKDALTSFENTAIKNMAILESSAKKVLDSGSPLLNKPLRTIDEKVLGSTELPIYRAARQIVVNEVAKLTNNPNLSGQLSDSARHEIESLLPADMTLGQLLNLLPTLKQDMRNRTSSLDEQIATIRQRISDVGGGGGGGTPAAPAANDTNRTRIKL